jgi:chromosomal replication initiator protein
MSAVADGETRYSPITVVGDIGVGKSEMLVDVRNRLRGKFPNLNVVYVKAETFLNAFLRALHEKGGMDKFRAHFRNVDVLLFDEIPFLEGKTKTEEEFFWMFDNLLTRGKVFICASNTPPSELKLEERVTSRLKGGLTVWIEPLDQDTRQELLKRLLKKDGLSWPAEVQDTVARSLDGDARPLIGVYETINARHQLVGDKITLELAREVLRPYLDGEDGATKFSLEIIEREVEFSFGFLHGFLRSGSRVKETCQARHLAMYLAMKLVPGITLTEIGDYFGDRNHTTVGHSCQVVDRALKEDKDGRLSRRYQDICSQLKVK